MTKLQEIKSIIDELRSDNSSNFKLQVLEKHKDNSDWKKYLYYTYNPNFNYYISKIPICEDINLNNNISFDELLTYLDKFKNQELRGHKGIETLYNILSNNPQYEVIELLIGRDIKCGINVTSINKVYKDLVPETPYCGCQGMNIDKIKEAIKNDGYVYSEVKSDGRYANAILKETLEIVSRGGKPTYLSDNCNLVKSLKDFRNNVLKEDSVLNGELMVKGYNRLQGNGIVARIININEKLQEGDIKKAEKSKKDLIKDFNKTFEELENLLYYVVWDLIPYQNYLFQKDSLPRKDRLQLLETFLQLHNFDINYIELQEYKKCYSFKEVIEDLKEKLDNGEEGTVVKSPNALWSHGKKEEQWKCKLEFDVELRIVGFNEGNKGTKLEGSLGSLKCISEDGLIEVNVGGLEEKAKNKDFDRDYIWNNQHEFLNKVVEIKCNGLSTNKQGGINFYYPNYVKMRFDKDKANTLEEIKEVEKSVLNTENELKDIKVNSKSSKSNNVGQSLQDFLNG